jgi:hypothetical protein
VIRTVTANTIGEREFLEFRLGQERSHEKHLSGQKLQLPRYSTPDFSIWCIALHLPCTCLHPVAPARIRPPNQPARTPYLSVTREAIPYHRTTERATRPKTQPGNSRQEFWGISKYNN